MTLPDHQSTRDPGPVRVATGHSVQFYETDEFLADVVARHAAEGIAGGEAVVLLITAAHSSAVQTRLIGLGVDVAAATAAGDLVVRDAHKVLEEIMAGPLVDDTACRAMFDALVAAVLADRLPGSSVRVFGEVVDLLWRDGNTVAALQVEDVWNDVMTRHPMTLVCGYSMSNFDRAEHHRAFTSICNHHSHVLPAEGYAQLDTNGRDREVNVLRQRARALEAELERRSVLEKALRDALTARRHSEEKLRDAKEEAERVSRAKSDFIAVMSHELRTPLNAIFGYEDLLRHEVSGALTDPQFQYLDRMRASARQLLSLVDQVLQLARIEAGREELLLEPVRPAQLAAAALESVEPVAAKAGIELRLEDETNSAEIESDAGKVRQILLNLLSNAAKFTEEGSITVSLRSTDTALTIDVSDTGPGIGEDQIGRIFEPFVQADSSTARRFGGSGLGLSVSRHLAELLGGELTVRSEVGEGSTFTLTLPASRRVGEGRTEAQRHRPL